MTDKKRNRYMYLSLYILTGLFLIYTLQDFILSSRLHIVSTIALILTFFGVVLIAGLNWEYIRLKMKQRHVKLSFNFIFMLIIVLGIFVFVYLLSVNNNLQWDSTSDTRYSLFPQSEKVIANLKTDVKILGFYGVYQERYEISRQGMDDLLQQYTLKGSQVSYQLYNINKEPDIAEKYEIKVPGTLVAVSGDRKEIINEPSEQTVTNAIIRVSRESKKKVYFLTGHGEKSREQMDARGLSSLDLELKNLSYETEDLNIPQVGGVVPTDCNLLIVAGPMADLFPIEWKAILDYMKRGGNLFLMIDPGSADWLGRRLRDLGVIVGNDIVVLEELSLADYATGNYYTAITNYYGNTEITRDFDIATLFDKVRSIKSSDKLPDGIVSSTLVSTLSNTHAEKLTPVPGTNQFQRSKQRDIPGPVPIGLTLTVNTEKWMPPEVKLESASKSSIQIEDILRSSGSKKGVEKRNGKRELGDKKQEARAVIVGDSEFAVDGYTRRSKGNRDFVLNIVAWLTHEGDLISIRPRDAASSPIILSERDSRVIFWVMVIVIPIGILITGGIVIGRRKRGYAKSRGE